ncbi:hypothetical protein [Stenotrophomonas maltophilia]|uniref:hypothetical protein n=1 Tax=Stenotrophomonas maltophilia TaxID=40324 RepID=UPI0008DE7FB5|nr:hypothetical protein [Stenotrophomonas maltophilia]OHY64669.1 hypothetical protein BB780_17770 [Stenotrophomonas maltophilia]
MALIDLAYKAWFAEFRKVHSFLFAGKSADVLSDAIAIAYRAGLASQKLANATRQPVGEPVAYTSETQLKAVRLCGDGIMSQRNAKWDIPLYLRPAQAVDLPYSLDADPAGIRARVADVITGTLMVGAQGHTPPPAGHWAEPFWQAARADATAQVVDLGQFREAVQEAYDNADGGTPTMLSLGELLDLIDSQAVGNG